MQIFKANFSWKIGKIIAKSEEINRKMWHAQSQQEINRQKNQAAKRGILVEMYGNQNSKIFLGTQLEHYFYHYLPRPLYKLTWLLKYQNQKVLMKMNRFWLLVNRHRMIPMSPQKESDRATAVWFASVFIQPHIPAPTGTKAVEGAEEVPWLGGGKPVDQREKSFAFCTKEVAKRDAFKQTGAIWTWTTLTFSHLEFGHYRAELVKRHRLLVQGYFCDIFAQNP